VSSPEFVVLYRWRLKPGKEESFIRAWSDRTKALLELGSLGSRLHQGDDGIWYSYAQWPSAEVRAAAFEMPLEVEEASKTQQSRQEMSDAILEELPDIVLTSVADFLK
jgi:heme-degrading monooxygenase HmoA